MFPDDGVGAERAKIVCWMGRAGDVCPVRRECLTQAIVTNEVFGVWGGYGQRDRVKIRKTWLITGQVRDLPGVALKMRKRSDRVLTLAS